MAAAIGLLLALTPLAGGLARALHDVQLGLLATREPSRDVVVFDIDDASLAALKPLLGGWPFKRDVYALVVEHLRQLGARAIAIDLLLADAGPGDAALARAIERPGAPVLLAAAGMRHASDGAAPGMAGPAPVQGPAAAIPAYVWPTIAPPAASVWPQGGSLLLGIITTPLDDDGVLRRLPLWHQDGVRRLPVMPWAVALAADAPGATAAPVLDRQGYFHLAMPAPPAWPEVRRFSELAFSALAYADAPALGDLVRGRVVFIGSSALLADAVMTPQGQSSGTLFLAQAYASLRQASWVRPPALLLDAALMLMALMPALWTVRRGRPAPTRDAAATALVAIVLASASLAVLQVWRQPTAWVPPLGMLAASLAMTWFEHQRGQASVRRRLAHELAVTEDAAKAKSAFLANVSHEIRTPLNALLGVADLLAQTQLTPQQRQHVQVFRESGQTLHSLINDLLDLSKIEAGHFELQPAPFDLRECLQRVVNLMRPRTEDKGLSLRLELAPALPVGVTGDRLRIEQALLNLLGNAVKFTSHGEIRLGVGPAPGAPGVLRFEVVDSGIGIAPSKLEHIFEPFSQADGTVTRIYGGTGLGLAITREVATLMGGSVQVHSTPGVGSTFALLLPLPEAELPAAPQPAPAPAPATIQRLAADRPLSVLLAEDNEVNVYIFSAMLAHEPLTLQVAPNGPAALELLRHQRFDIAFLDVQMPGMDGLRVTRELRALEAASGRARTPVVILTANAFASDVQASYDAGCDRHLAKPFSRDQLIGAIVELALATVGCSAASQPTSATGRAETAEVAPAPMAVDAAAVLDQDSALQRLGGDKGQYQRLKDHAVIFLANWAEAFEQAQLAGNVERAHRLAHDLKSIAASVGAYDLSDRAAALEGSLRGTGDNRAPDAAALGRTLDALNPVIAVLTMPVAEG